jgi:GNAT superfamily N-acetyltransferase
MWWRITRKEFERNQGNGNREAMRSLVEDGVVPGILGYVSETPVGWCSIAPREEFSSLERSPVLKRLDDQPVWSIVCFFIDKTFRGQGYAEELLRCALDYAEKNGAVIVEAYPSRLKSEKLPPVSSFMGLPPVYKRVGFKVRAEPSKSKLIMRYRIKADF